MTVLARRIAAAIGLVLAAGCMPHVGITVTNAPVIQECIPGSATRPCP